MPKPAQSLTDTKIKQSVASKKPIRLFDGKVTGLHLLIQPNGSKLWRLRYKFGGKEKRMSIGQYPTISLSEARETAAKLLYQVRQGADPSVPVEPDKLIVGKKITFGEITKNYIQIAGKRKSDQRIFKIQQALNKHVLPYWAEIEIDRIKAGDVIKLLQKTEESGTYITTCVHRYIGWIFDHAVSIGEIDSIPVTNASLNHIAPHRSMNVRSMDFSLVPEFLADLDDYQGKPITKLAVKFIMITAVRTIELRRLRWGWLDAEKALIKVPASQHKTGIRKENAGEEGEDFYILLSRQALRILEKARGITGEEELVFPSPRNFKMEASDAIINKSLERMGWKDRHDGHGFRALFRSEMEKRGYDTKILELSLGHSLGRSKTESAYARGMNQAFFPERLKIMQSWADLIDSIKKP